MHSTKYEHIIPNQSFFVNRNFKYCKFFVKILNVYSLYSINIIVLRRSKLSAQQVNIH